MAAIYQAENWCDECADAIRFALQAIGAAPLLPSDETSYDSDEYPKTCSDDAESDTPTHCAAGGDCFSAETLPSGRLVGKLFGALTSDGEAYVLETHHHSPSEVTALWLDYYDLTPDTENS